MQITIELPFEPVGWKAPKGDRRRYSPENYRAWKAHAALTARLVFNDEPWDSLVALEIEVRCKDNRRGDLTNYVKAVEDALEVAGVIKNDKQVIEQHNRLVIDRDNAGVTVTISKVDASGEH